jgi:hypothetical protein
VSPSTSFTLSSECLSPVSIYENYAFAIPFFPTSVNNAHGTMIQLSARCLEHHNSPGARIRANSHLLFVTFMNPVLVLHCFNGFLSCFNSAKEPPSNFNTSIQPHFDVNKQDRLCWLFTFAMVGMQLTACCLRMPESWWPNIPHNNADR